MSKKSLAAIAIAVLALFAVPTAANASGYVAADHVSVAGAQVAGGTVAANFAAGSFTASEKVSFAVSGSGTAVLTTLRAGTVTLVKDASAAGATSVNVTLPANATGTYSVTATGMTSANIATAAVTVVAADAGASTLPSTGFDVPVLAIWGATGVLLLGIALMVVMSIVRRQRATA